MVTTVDDGTDEPHGTVTATVRPGRGYTVGSPSSGTRDVRDNDVPGQTTNVSITSNNQGQPVTEGGHAIFLLKVSPPSQQAIVVNLNYATTGDFGISSGVHTVTIPSTSGSTYRHYVPVINDNVDEPDGSLTVTVQSGNNYVPGNPKSASATLLDNDIPTVNVTAGADVIEGGSATFTVTASPTPQKRLSVEVYVGSTGEFGVADGLRTVSFPANTGTATLSVDTTNDSTAEADGEVRVTIQSSAYYKLGNPSGDSVVVMDNDGPEISITGSPDMTEGGDAVFTISANRAPDQPIPVNIFLEATGEFYDFIPGDEGALTVIVPTSGSVDHPVYTVDDTIDEPVDGVITVTLQPGSGYTLGSPDTATINIADDDVSPAGTPSVTISAGNDVEEGDSASFTLTANPAPAAGQTITVGLNVDIDEGTQIDPTNSSGVDTQVVSVWDVTSGKTYSYRKWEVELSSATATFSIATRDNTHDNADATLSVGIKSGAGYMVGTPSADSVTVADDDVPTVSLWWAGHRSGIIKENGNARFNVTVNTPPHDDLTVSVNVAATGDFGVQTGAKEVVIPGGASSKNFSIALVPDHVDEPHGSITVTVNPHSSYSISSWSSASVTVQDDDDPEGPTVTIQNAPKVWPGETLVFAVILNKPASGVISMDYEISDHSPMLIPGLDYWDDNDETSGSIEIQPGEVEGIINVHTSSGAPSTQSSMILVSLSNLVGGSKFGTSVGTGRLHVR